MRIREVNKKPMAMHICQIEPWKNQGVHHKQDLKYENKGFFKYGALKVEYTKQDNK